MNKFLIASLLVIGTFTTFAKEWTIEISPQQLKMCSGIGLQRPKYFIDKCRIKNMVNLSFFTTKTFIPPYKDLGVSDLRNPKKWPFLTIEGDGFPFIYDGKELNNSNFEIIRNETKFIASGFPILIREGIRTKISRSYFSRRKCPRTVVGIHPNGSMIIYVTTAGTLREVQNHMVSLGCIDALNFDGGSSTFLYLGGKKVFSSNEGKSYPNVLYWD